MALTKYDDLLEHLVTEFPGAEEPIIKQRLYEAGRAFCDASHVWEETLDAINLVDGTREYPLKPKWQAEVAFIRQVRINTSDGVSAGNQGYVLDDELYWMERDDTGMFAKLVFAESAEPGEDVTGGLVVQVTLVPSAGKHTLPVWLLQRHYEAFVAHVCMVLMTRNPNDPYFNPARAEYWGKQWRKELIRASRDRQARGRERPRGLLEDPEDSE